MINLQEAKFHRKWCCEMKGCNRVVRIFRDRHHCRMCGMTICKEHSFENVTLVSSLHKIATNYKKVCTGCYDVGCADINKDKTEVIIKPSLLDGNVSQSTTASSISAFSSPSNMEQIDTSSVKSSNSGVENESPTERVETLLKKLQIKNQRIKELENRVNAQAKELQSIAGLVEKKITKMQTDIAQRNNTIRTLETEKQKQAEQLNSAQSELDELRRHRGE